MTKYFEIELSASTTPAGSSYSWPGVTPCPSPADKYYIAFDTTHPISIGDTVRTSTTIITNFISFKVYLTPPELQHKGGAEFDIRLVLNTYTFNLKQRDSATIEEFIGLYNNAFPQSSIANTSNSAPALR